MCTRPLFLGGRFGWPMNQMIQAASETLEATPGKTAWELLPRPSVNVARIRERVPVVCHPLNLPDRFEVNLDSACSLYPLLNAPDREASPPG